VTVNAWGIAAAIVVWVAGLTGILLTTAPQETRALWRWSTRPRRDLGARRSLADIPSSDGDVVDSRHTGDARRGRPERDRARAAADVGLFRRVGLGGSMMATTNAPQQAVDPLAQQAATLLAKAMVTAHDRDLLWQRFHDLVVTTTAEMEEAPVRDAIDEIERRGLSLDVVARVVQQRLSE
jgi:hypothetical protein